MNHAVCFKSLALCLVLALSLVGCKNDEPDKSKAEKEEVKDERVPVETAEIALGSIESVVLSSANLEAEESVKVYSRTTNQVVELLVEEGDTVREGQLLVRLEDGSHKLQLAKAEARLSKAQREFDRADDLFKKEFLSKEDLNNATYELKQAQVQFAEAERELSYTEITAPIKGTITSRLVNLGDFVSTNQHLFDIVNYQSIVARVFLPEKNLSRLKEGQRARLTSRALSAEHFNGTVKRIAPLVDAKTGTVKVTVAVDDTDKLMPGMYVDVALVLEVNDQAVLLPKQALVYDNDQVFAFKIDRSGPRIIARRVLVEPALTDETRVMPASGFAAGDEIVMAGHTGLKDQAVVRVLGEADPEAKPKEEARGPEGKAGEVALND